MTMTKVEEVVSLIVSRDQKGLKILYENYADALYGIILRIAKDKSVAEEILQESLLKIWNKIELFDSSKSTFFTWMAAISRNTALDKVRLVKFQNNQKTKSIDPNVYYGEVNHEQNSKIDVEKLLGKLDQKYKLVLDKIYLEGYTHSDLSEELNIPIGTIKTRIRKALEILRSEMQNEQYLWLGALFVLLIMIWMLWI